MTRPFTRRALAFLAYASFFALCSFVSNGVLLRFHLPVWTSPPTVLLAGDSHLAFSLDPDSIAGAVSLGRPSELLFLTEHKLDFLLDRSPAPGTVVLALAPQNISTRWQRHILVDAVGANHQTFADYYSVVPWDEVEADFPRSLRWRYAVRNVLTPNLHLWGDLIAHLVGREAARTHPWVGTFQSPDRNILTSTELDASIARHFGDGVADDAIAAARHIARSMRERGIELVVYCPPLRPEYRRRVPREILRAYESLLSELAAQEGVRVIDLRELRLPDPLWANYDHVNRDGSAVVSATLAARLRGGTAPDGSDER